METIRNIHRLRQARQFVDRPIAEDAWRDILEAARWCGSSRNSQPWQFLVVKEKATLAKLAEIIPYGKFLPGAAVAIAFAMEGEGTGYSLDAGRVVQNTMLAAKAHGVGSGLATMSSEELDRQARQALGVPDGWSVRAVVAFGYPVPRTAPVSEAEKAAARIRPSQGRKPLNELVSYEKWGARTP